MCAREGRVSAEVPLSRTMAGKEITQLPLRFSSRLGPGRPLLAGMGCAAVPRTEGNIYSNAFQNILISMCV